MKFAARMILVAALLVGIVQSAGAQNAGGIKPGEWEFNTQLRPVAMPELPAGVTLPPGAKAAASGVPVTHKQCVEPDKAVPSDPRRECKVDRINRNASVITWSTTCEVGMGTVVSAGTARYHGDTMEASMNVRAPNGSGGFIETTQHITGRYLGPCPAK